MAKLYFFYRTLRNKVGGTSLGRFLKKIINICNSGKLKSANVARYSSEILDLVSCWNLNSVLFYGTLLEYTRNNGEIAYADDYDFILICDKDKAEFIKTIRSSNFELKSIIATGHGKLLQVSFYYKHVSVDFCFGNLIDNTLIHEFVNFRRTHGILTGSEELEIKTYPELYRLKISDFLIERLQGNVFVPKTASQVLTSIYDSEWQKPKSDNFVDYSNYEFIEDVVHVYSGSQSRLGEVLDRFNN